MRLPLPGPPSTALSSAHGADCRPQASVTCPAPSSSCSTLTTGNEEPRSVAVLGLVLVPAPGKQEMEMVFLGCQRPGQPAGQGQPHFNPFLEAEQLPAAAGTCSPLHAGVRAFLCPRAVQGSVGTDGNMGPSSVCGVRHRSFPSRSPVLPPLLCVKGPHGHCLQQGLGFLSRGPEPRGTSVRAPHNWSPTPSSLAGLVVRTGLCRPQAGSELNLWSWCPQSPSSSPWGHDHWFPVGDVCRAAHTEPHVLVRVPAC